MEFFRNAKGLANARRGRRLLLINFISIIWLAVLYTFWLLFGPAVGFLLGLATVIQVLISNLAQIRSLLPGLEQVNRWINALSTIGYILLVFWLVSEMGKGN